MESAFLVLKIGVASQIPAVADVRLLAGIGEVAAPRRSSYCQSANGSRLHCHHLGIDDLRFVSGHGTAGNPGPCVVDPIGNKNMQQLSRADAIEH